MANPNVTFRNARKRVGFSDEHMQRVREAANARMETSPFVAVMRKVQNGEMTVDDGEREVKRLMES